MRPEDFAPKESGQGPRSPVSYAYPYCGCIMCWASLSPSSDVTAGMTIMSNTSSYATNEVGIGAISYVS
jgi:hypothetical protein